MIDPRASVVERRMAGIGRILAFAGAKGGVGKSTCAAGTALRLAAHARVGLLDLDFQGAVSHLLLGVKPSGFPEESGGILPLKAPGAVSFMSVAAFVGDAPIAMRGADLTNAMLELLAVTIWPELDTLVIDMPPGMADTVLDLLRLIPRAATVVVTTPSRPALVVAGRFLDLLQEVRADLEGVLLNMVRTSTGAGRELADRHGVPYLGEVPFDEHLEGVIGKPEEFAASAAGAALVRAFARS